MFNKNKNVRKLARVRNVLTVMLGLFTIAFIACTVYLTIRMSGNLATNHYRFLIALCITTVGSMTLAALTYMMFSIFSYVIVKRQNDLRYVNTQLKKDAPKK